MSSLYIVDIPFSHLTTMQIEIFNGEENVLTLNQTYSKKFHCTYLLHYYPFDTQVHTIQAVILKKYNKCVTTKLTIQIFRSALWTCS